jgi:hypothetical protein
LPIIFEFILLADYYIRFSEWIELFFSRRDAQAQAAKEKSQKVQLENILNEL